LRSQVLAALVSASYHVAITISDVELSLVEDGSSKARWKDYSISASAILLVVAALSGKQPPVGENVCIRYQSTDTKRHAQALPK